MSISSSSLHPHADEGWMYSAVVKGGICQMVENSAEERTMERAKEDKGVKKTHDTHNSKNNFLMGT